LNPQPVNHKSNALPLSHHAIAGVGFGAVCNSVNRTCCTSTLFYSILHVRTALHSVEIISDATKKSKTAKSKARE